MMRGLKKTYFTTKMISRIKNRSSVLVLFPLIYIDTIQLILSNTTAKAATKTLYNYFKL